MDNASAMVIDLRGIWESSNIMGGRGSRHRGNGRKLVSTAGPLPAGVSRGMRRGPGDGAGTSESTGSDSRSRHSSAGGRTSQVI